jgi:hypothetical protein
MAALNAELVRRLLDELRVEIPAGISLDDVVRRAQLALDDVGSSGPGAARLAIRTALEELSREALAPLYATEHRERFAGGDVALSVAGTARALAVTGKRSAGDLDYRELADGLAAAQAELDAAHDGKAVS